MSEPEHPRRLPPAERNSPKDWYAVAAIVLAIAVVIAVCVFTAPVQRVESTVASNPLSANETGRAPSSDGPRALTETWSTPDPSQPLTVGKGGVLVRKDDHTVVMLRAATGEQVWRYRAADPICSSASNGGYTLVVTRSAKGCGEVVSLNTEDGSYHATRAALASDKVAIQSSNDNVGTVSSTRVELWRDDLVRTVEVGKVEAPAQAGKQLHPACQIGSALWRKDLLAVMQRCEEANVDVEADQHDGDKGYVRLMKTVPEDSSEPEDHTSWTLPYDAVLVAVSQDRALVYVPTGPDTAEFQVLNKDGEADKVQTFVAPYSTLAHNASAGFSPETADLPENMTWWDGQRLIGFNPASLAPTWTVEGALGTGAAMSDRLLVPVRDGIAVVNWSTGKTERVIPVDRGGAEGPVKLAVQGRYVIEQRSTGTTVLEAS